MAVSEEKTWTQPIAIITLNMPVFFFQASLFDSTILFSHVLPHSNKQINNRASPLLHHYKNTQKKKKPTKELSRFHRVEMVTSKDQIQLNISGFSSI